MRIRDGVTMFPASRTRARAADRPKLRGRPTINLHLAAYARLLTQPSLVSDNGLHHCSSFQRFISSQRSTVAVVPRLHTIFVEQGQADGSIGLVHGLGCRDISGVPKPDPMHATVNIVIRSQHRV